MGMHAEENDWKVQSKPSIIHDYAPDSIITIIKPELKFGSHAINHELFLSDGHRAYQVTLGADLVPSPFMIISLLVCGGKAISILSIYQQFSWGMEIREFICIFLQ